MKITNGIQATAVYHKHTISSDSVQTIAIYAGTYCLHYYCTHTT